MTWAIVTYERAAASLGTYVRASETHQVAARGQCLPDNGIELMPRLNCQLPVTDIDHQAVKKAAAAYAELAKAPDQLSAKRLSFWTEGSFSREGTNSTRRQQQSAAAIVIIVIISATLITALVVISNVAAFSEHIATCSFQVLDRDAATFSRRRAPAASRGVVGAFRNTSAGRVTDVAEDGNGAVQLEPRSEVTSIIL